ncbi:AraC family transcriptional regulator [Rhizobium hainanense]|nr:AraC family transcriptional regulator [Rhizobium hainanense]
MLEALADGFGPLEAWRTGRDRPLNWKVGFWGNAKLSVVSNQDAGGWGARTGSGNPETLAIIVPRAGALEVSRGRAQIEGTPGQLLLLNGREADRVLVQDAPHRSDTLSLSWQTFTQVAAAILEKPLIGSIDLAPVVNVSTAAGQSIANLAQTIIMGMRDDGPLLSSPIAMSNLGQALADLIVRSIPHRHSLLLHKKVHVISPRHVRRAVEFMHTNMAEPLTMLTVAEEAGVSLRSLEMGFKNFKGTTPAAYLRAIRLQAVHQDLLDPSDESSTRDICIRWGFLHPGRFAAVYRTVYGENPSDTRKRSRR